MSHKSKWMLPVLAVIVGAAASAFTVKTEDQNSAQAEEYYWFQYNEDGSQILNQTTRPSASATDPYGCSGHDVNCAQAFTSYDSTMVGTQKEYTPGTPSSLPIDKKAL